LSASIQNMLQRETVAGDAALTSWTSNSARIGSPPSLTRSPLGRKNMRVLSSSTVLMFSIQIASTGPPKTARFRSIVWLAIARYARPEPRLPFHSTDALTSP
jgi:hypothetical protein